MTMNIATPKDSPKAPRKPSLVEDSAAPSINIASLSNDELARLIAEGEKELAERREREREEFLARTLEQARALGLDPRHVAAALTGKPKRADRRSVVKAKYRNPANPSETWSGRGQKPKWLEALLGEGRKVEEFVISAAGS